LPAFSRYAGCQVKSKNISDQTGETVTQTGYNIFDKTDNGFLCRAFVDTDNGSRFEFQDEIVTHDNGIFSIKRKVTVVDVGNNDEGFSSQITFFITSATPVSTSTTSLPRASFTEQINTTTTGRQILT
jgi:hypothetical protein